MHNLCSTGSEVAVHLERLLSNETSIRINHVGSTSLQSVLAVFVTGAQGANLGKIFKLGHPVFEVIIQNALHLLVQNLEPFNEVPCVRVIPKCPMTLAEKEDRENKKGKHPCTLQGTRLSPH